VKLQSARATRTLRWCTPLVAFVITTGGLALCASAQAAVAVGHAAAPGGSSAKLSPRLSLLAAGSGAASRAVTADSQARALSLPSNGAGALVRRPDGGLLVEIRLSSSDEATVARLRGLGAQVMNVSSAYSTVTAAVSAGALTAIASDPTVQYVSEVLAPQVDRAAVVKATGGVTPMACAPIVSEGDTLMNVAAARSANNLDGSTETVGILSDSFDTVSSAPTRAADDIAAGDLPGAGNPCGYTTPVTVQADYSGSGRSDEGRAMAQLVHDLAPGANLAFATAANGEFDYADQITKLRTVNHATEIVDDLGYLDEPFFQDGPVAVAANAASAAGVPYFSAAGNSNVVVSGQNVSSYEAPAYRSTPCPAGTVFGESVLDCHDFDPTAGTANTDAITLAPSGGFGLDLQWAQPWGGVTTNLDAFVLNSNGSVIASSKISNTASQRPFEFLAYQNTSATPQTVRVVVARKSGTALPRLKFIFVGGSDITDVQWNTSSGGDIVGPSIFGHSGTGSVGGTAAIPFDDANTSEDYSSRGPETLYFQPTPATAALAAPQVIDQPTFAATDGVQTSFFAEQVGGVWRFYGTSAAAPQAAAIGALLHEQDPALTPAQLMSTLAVTAQPVTNGGGPEAVGGGYLDADAALASVTSLPGAPSTPTTINGDSHVTVQWSVPQTNPHFPVTGFVVREYLAGVVQDTVTVDAGTTSQLFSGLTNGATYTFTVTASNANGSGPESTPASVVIAVPNPPTGVTAVAGSHQAEVSWSAPPADDLTITGYTVSAIINGVTKTTQTFNTAATTQTITGLTNGSPYTFKVASIDAFATGPFSAESSVVTPADVPDSPIVTVYPYFDNAADVSWGTGPTDNGSPITNYIVTTYQNGTSVGSEQFPASSGAVVFSLTNGQPYAFTVAAKNARGTGAPSALSRVIIAGSPVPPAVPPTATPGNASANVSWTEPQNHSSSQVSGYTVYAYVNGTQVASQIYNSTATTEVFGGLTNGTTYAFAVAASNTNGLGPPTAMGSTTVVGSPSAPGAPGAVPGNARATIHWSAPANNGAVINGYVITPYVDGVAQSSTAFNSAATTETVLGLTNGTTYTFTVAAKNSRGTGPDSVPTLPIRLGTPLAPTAVKAVPGTANATTGSLTVSYTAGANNGAAITKYTATCTSPGGVTKSGVHNGATAAAIVVTGLTTKKAYTCRVTETNAQGTSSASAASSAVIVGTPKAPAKPTIVKTAAGSLKVSFTAPAANGAPITSYTATCTSSNAGVTRSKSATKSPITVTALSVGKTYTCTVRAINSRGAGPLSPPSSPATA
jgi:hypothetical protein